jgi:4-carboxymuconolactone decarboxylase
MSDRYTEGMAVRRDVLGSAPVDRAVAGTDGFTAEFQELITRYAWGEIWTRDGLDRRTRSAITLAMLATLRADAELALHVRAALRNGLRPDEIKEVLLQVAIYAGVPAANTAFAIAQRVFAEPPAEPAPESPAASEPPAGSVGSPADLTPEPGER